ncbi:GmrSD restriction endonuclease domain-containing protein, partial [Staphylococcus arlettae]|uniref:GmrSD restriction endonuclease domain-containing protein n=1 Tax=Staphylococcus arlettae TaxID=29378 RepID=UPI000E6A3186
TLNYEYFYSCIDNMNISIDQLMSSIQKLQFMVVNLNSPDDDPQLIFESLNSTGVALTDADKIRNFLLMRICLNKISIFKTIGNH